MRRALAVWLCAMMLAGAFAGVSWHKGGVVEGKAVLNDGVMYVTHASIRINSNAEFAAKAASEGWNGSGIISDQWIIENYEINGSGRGCCIYIGNSTVYFTIKSCLLREASGSSGSFFYNSGITFIAVSNGKVEKNVMRNSSRGMTMYTGSNIRIANNTIDNNTNYGIYMATSSNVAITNNSMHNNGIYVGGSAVSHWNTHTIDTSNLVNGKPLYYLKNINGGKVPLGAGQVILAACQNIIVENQNISNASVGILMGYSTYCYLRNNSLYGNYIGIYLREASHYCTAINNTISDSVTGLYSYACQEIDMSINRFYDCGIYLSGNGVGYYNSHWIGTTNVVNGKGIQYLVYNGYMTVPLDAGQVILVGGIGMTVSNQTISNASVGIGLYYCNNISVTDNNLATNSISGIEMFNSDTCAIQRNNITRNGYGIYFLYCDDNIISMNNIINNYYGITMSGSVSNDIYWNNLVYNNYNIDNQATNYWNSTYPGGGNYWYDYGGNDEYSSIGQNITGSDGLGDTPYTSILWGTAKDKYPLMHPYVWWCEVGPSIELLSPINNSANTPGTILFFDIYDENLNLNITNYSIDGGPRQSFSINYRIDTTGWADQHHSIEVQANDTMGNTCSRTFEIIIDSVSPVIVLNSPSNNSLILSGTDIDISFNETNAMNATFTVNGGSSLDLVAPYNISTGGWPDGNYIIRVDAVDQAGNSDSEIYIFTIDSTAPIITLEYPANNSFIKQGTLINMSIVDSHLSIAYYSINLGLPKPFIPPYDINTTGWTDGTYSIYVQGMDDLGNHESSVFVFIYDSNLPEIHLISPANNSLMHSGTVIDLNVSDPNLDYIEYSVNGGLMNSLLSPYDITTTGWADGTYLISAQAIDKAGNMNHSSCSFTIDSTVPNISLNNPANCSVVRAGTMLDFNVNDTHLNATNYSINGGFDIAFPAPYDVDTSGWADGEYFITIEANDGVGNWAIGIFVFVIDSTAPVIGLNTPGNNSFIPAGTILDIDIQDTNLDYAQYSVNLGVFQILPMPYNISTTGWSDGDYIVTVQAFDDAGNIHSESYQFTIDSLTPTIILNSPANGTINLPGTILDFNVTDIHLTSVTYSVNSAPNQVFAAPYDLNTAVWLDGEYSISIWTSDMAGNAANKTFLFIIDSTPPVIILNSPANNSVIQAGVVLNFTVNDRSIIGANFSLNGGLPQLLTYPYDIPTTGWINGNNTVRVQAVNSVGLATDVFFRFTIDSTVLMILLNSPINNSVIQSGTILDFNVTDIYLTSVTYSINAGSIQAITAPYDIYTIGWSNGDYSITIWASDEVGNSACRTFLFIIDSTAPSIFLISPVNNSVVKAGTVLNFNVSDSHLNIVNYSVNGGSSSTFSAPFDIYTNTWVDGNYLIQINAKDGADNEISRVFNFTIDSTPPEIILVSPANNSTIRPGDILDFTILDDNIYDVSYVYQWFEYDLTEPYDISTSGWPAGNYSIIVMARDKAGNSNSTVYKFTIDGTPPSILLLSPVNNSAIQPGIELNFNVYDNIDISNVSYSLNGGPPNPFSAPYDISTNGWLDGTYTIKISANDSVGNSAERIFNLIIDSTPPTVNTGIDVLERIQFLQDATATDSLSGITAYLWSQLSGPGTVTFGTSDAEDTTIIADTDGVYVIRLTVFDKAWNVAFDEFTLTWDENGPIVTITIGEPKYEDSILLGGTWYNSTYILPSTPINLAVADDGGGVSEIWYKTKFEKKWVPGDPTSTLEQFWSEWTLYTGDLPWETWESLYSGGYMEFYAKDNYGINGPLTKLSLWWDLYPPDVELTPSSAFTPDSGIICFTQDTILSINAIDDSVIADVWYNVDGGPWLNYSNPFTLADGGGHNISYYAHDVFGRNSTIKTSYLWVDDSAPLITVSNIMSSYGIWFNVSDPCLWDVSWCTGANNIRLYAPYFISTNSLVPGWYNYTIWASDALGHSCSKVVTVHIPNPTPSILRTKPVDGATDISTTTRLVIVFSAPMDTASVQSALSITNLGSDQIISFFWNSGKTILTIIFGSRLNLETTYTVKISADARDYNDMHLDDDYSFSFTTFRDTDNDDKSDIIDTDDDGDGFLDEWEIYLGTDPLDPEEKPRDTDEDGLPDGDATNIQPWMDTDDDNDGTLDAEENLLREPGFISQYWWVIVLIAVVVLAGFVFVFRRKRTPPDESGPSKG